MNTPRTSKLAIVALICAILVWPLGIILGIVALIRINGRREELGGMGLAIASIVIGVLFSMFLGVFAAIAIPNFVKFQCRSKQSAAKVALKSLYVSELSYEAETGRFGQPDEVGYQAFPGSKRYELRIVSIDNEATPRTFVAEAKAIAGELDGDTWTITQDNQLTNTVQGCH